MEANVNVTLTSMLLSIDSFQNRVSTDQYDMIVLQAQVYGLLRWCFLVIPLSSYLFSIIMIARSGPFFLEGLQFVSCLVESFIWITSERLSLRRSRIRASLLPWLYLLNYYAQCTLMQVLVTSSVISSKLLLAQSWSFR